MSDLDDLADFLLNRIAEDEEAAEFAANSPMSRGPEWVAVEGAQEAGYTVRYERMGWELTENGNFAVSDASHIARWDPARVLAECEARRALVLELARMLQDEAGWDGIEEKVMGYLALPYASHPDYRQEWRP